MKKLIGRRGLVKRMHRISEITGMVTILFMAVMTGQLLYMLPIGTIRAEPIVGMLVGVAVFYLIMVILSWLEKK